MISGALIYAGIFLSPVSRHLSYVLITAACTIINLE